MLVDTGHLQKISLYRQMVTFETAGIWTAYLFFYGALLSIVSVIHEIFTSVREKYKNTLTILQVFDLVPDAVYVLIILGVAMGILQRVLKLAMKSVKS